MKKAAALFMLLWVASTVCGCKSGGSAVSFNQTSMAVQQAVDQWPQNEYTTLLPKPEFGVPFSVVLNQTTESYAIFLQDSTRQEGEAYIGKLKEDGFAEVHKESEEKAVSALLQKEDVFVSVAVADTGFAIYISFKE